MIGVVNPDQLHDAVSWQDALSAVHDSLMHLAAGRVIQPPAVEIRMPGHGELHVKGGHVVDDDWIVVKGTEAYEVALAEGAALSTAEAIAFAQRGRGERKRPASGWESLTPAERDVIRLLSEGLSNKEIAARLFISPRTAQTHLTHIYSKLNLSSRVAVVQEAARHIEAEQPDR